MYLTVCSNENWLENILLYQVILFEPLNRYSIFHSHLKESTLPNAKLITNIKSGMLNLIDRFMCVIIILMSSNNLDVNEKMSRPCLGRQITNHMSISLKYEGPIAGLPRLHLLCLESLYP